MQGFHVTRFAEEGNKKRRASDLGDVRVGCDVAYSSSGISVSSQKRTVTFSFCITYSALPK